MKRLPAATTAAMLLSGAIYGQQSDIPPKGNQPGFDIADVRVHPHSSNSNVYMTGGVLRNGRYDLRKATMLDLIATAWSVDPDTVLGGPGWLEWERFDIAAKAPARTSPDTLKLMLQSLLTSDSASWSVTTLNQSPPTRSRWVRASPGSKRPKAKERRAARESPGTRHRESSRPASFTAVV